MEIHPLRYFCAVARNGTFELLRNNYPVMVRALAAQVERVAQPSLSQQILKFEAELRCKAARLTWPH